MQSQIYVAGQPGQLAQVFNGGVPLMKSVTYLRKPWHSDNDLSLRREILLHIAKHVQKYGWETKMPSIAHNLEMALYAAAESKDDYGNLNTLERRIWVLVLRSSQKSTQLGPSPGAVISNKTCLSAGTSNFANTGVAPILSNSSGSIVLPNARGASMHSVDDIDNHSSMSGCHKNLLAATTFQPLSSGFNTFNRENKDFMSDGNMQKAGSRMIPTPGLSSNGGLSSNLMNFHGGGDDSTNSVHQNSLGSGPGLTNFQRGSLLKSNTNSMNTRLSNCLQTTRSNQMFMNIGVNLNSSSHNASVKADLGHMPSSFSLSIDQSLSQQQYSKHGMGVEGVDIFAANTESSNLGSFQESQVQICTNPSSVASMTPTSFSALLLSEHSDANLSQQMFTQRFAQSSAASNSPIFSVVSQELQQPGQTLVISNHLDSKDSEVCLSNSGRRLSSSAGQIVNADLLVTQNNQLERSNQLLYVQQDLCQQQHHQEQQHRYQHQTLSFGNKEKILITTDAGNGSLPQLESDSLQTCCPQVVSVDQHSEQTCQASSADTGQSEVVSNDGNLAQCHGKDSCKQDYSTFVKQQQWLLLMFWHVNRCTDPKQCNVQKCEAGHLYWNHVITCRKNPCKCVNTKQLLRHHHKCRNAKCIICGPVRSYLSPEALAARSKLKQSQTKQLANNHIRAASTNEADSPPVKRSKLDVMLGSSFHPQDEAHLSVSTTGAQEQARSEDTLLSKDEAVSDRRDHEFIEAVCTKIESPMESSVSAGSKSFRAMDKWAVGAANCSSLKAKQILTPNDTDQKASLPNVQVLMPSESASITKKKVPGISYLECLTSEQIRQHICSLRKWIGQSKAKAERNQALEHNMSSSACSACAAETLHFDPIPVFCTQCGCRIKRNAVYYASGSGDSMLIFCGPCHSSIRVDTIDSDGIKIQKSSLEKKRNDEQRLEAWVECDKCKKWQHQVCALFNARINKERSEYVCPECCIAEIERGERVPRPANSVLGAKDLPRSALSDFVEERLAFKLDHERAERAKASGRCLDEVPTAEGLVVRVISSVDKKLEVKPRFWEIFQQEDYPKDFMYKSKMLMLFQEIEGVEVCIFGMYVQEFGAESPQPNRRHTYLSYLDSVKYFRPDVKAVTGEALRTYVYHEILIAYLDYCKRRGFSSCYIWACPPLKGDDYILYCHPEIQKTPKTDKLREWYLSMIVKAKKENIVTSNKNLHDFYFTSNNECKAKITATRLPYFDGDYWPGAAEDILQQLQEEEEGSNCARKGKTNKLASTRTLKTFSNTDVIGNTCKDLQLMSKLGQTIAAMKDDFIMVHMHHACSRCRNFITGHRWFCQICGDNFQLCEECYGEHEQLCEEERHPAGKKDSHPLIAEKVMDIPASTLDRDEIMECEYFDNRQAFLSLCQGNQYQYDTLRRAKHSSMMILYHLHNPNAPAFVSSCAICHTELEAGHGWKCNICDYDVCKACYQGKAVKHPHELVSRAIPADQNAANGDDRTQRIIQLRMMLMVLAHCAKCIDASCQFAKCKNMKDLFRHGYTCHKRAAGGCPLCKRMWFLLTAHARSCKESLCTVPRCKDIRQHLSRAQQQQESRRRAAFNEMIRQRAAETGGAH